jgi:cell division protein FtsZ
MLSESRAIYGSVLTGGSDERDMITVPPVGDDEREPPQFVSRAALVRIIKPRVEEILEMVRDRLAKSPFAITVIGVGGAGGNAVNNMIERRAGGRRVRRRQHRRAGAAASRKPTAASSWASTSPRGLGAGAQPEIGRAAAEEALERSASTSTAQHGVHHRRHGRRHRHRRGAGHRQDGARAWHPDRRRGHQAVPLRRPHRMRLAEAGIAELQQYVDTLIVIPNQNLFRIANERTTFADAFKMADQVLHSGVRGVTDLMVMPGLINLDFADVRTVMSEMGKAMMGTGEADRRRPRADGRRGRDLQPAAGRVSLKGAKAC